LNTFQDPTLDTSSLSGQPEPDHALY